MTLCQRYRSFQKNGIWSWCSVVGRWDYSKSLVCDESHLSPPSLLHYSNKHVSLRLPRRLRRRPNASHFLEFSKHHVDLIHPLTRGFLHNQSNCQAACPPPTDSFLRYQRHTRHFQQFPRKERDIPRYSGKNQPAGSFFSDVSPFFEQWSRLSTS